MYTDSRVIELVSERFIPVRVHAREQADEFQKLGQRFSAQWTPTILVVDPDGNVRHRIEGFLPADEFLAQLTLGLAHEAFANQRFEEAARGFNEVLAKYPNTEAAPEAQYWAGVSRYKASGDASALKATANAFTQRYSDSNWAKKASVWA